MPPSLQPGTLNPQLIPRVTKLITRIILESTGRDLVLEPDAALVSSGYLDSMSLVNLVVAMQTEFAIDLDVSDMNAERFESIRSISTLVTERQAPAADADA